MYVQPQAPQPKPSIAKAIVSIALGGWSILMAAISSLYSLIFAGLGEGEVGIAFTVVMAFFVIPTGIVSLVMGNGYLKSNADRVRGLAKGGKIMGIVSIALVGFSLLMNILALM